MLKVSVVVESECKTLLYLSIWQNYSFSENHMYRMIHYRHI